ncbi:MAG: hypothetical protein SGI77_28375 [Pirellulaceae bacterium]|nr:hypothetical protein [Pirellulaceae bacterium]
MTTAAEAVTKNAPETDSRKTQVTVSRAIHVLSTEDEPRQVVTHRDRTCRNLESEEKPVFSWVLDQRGFLVRRGASVIAAESRPVMGAAEQRATGPQNNQSMTTSGL